jgi:hypothetical protein
VTGPTSSNNFTNTGGRPTTDLDAFVVEMANANGANASVLNALYISGANGFANTSTDDGTAIAVASDGIYVAGWSQLGIATGAIGPPPTDNFPNTGSAQPGRSGAQDGFVLKVAFQPLALTPDNSSVLPGSEIDFVATGGTGPGTYHFSFGTNASLGQLDGNTGVYIAGQVPGNDIVKVTDGAGITAFANVTVLPPEGSSSGSTSGGNGSVLNLNPLVTSTFPKGTVHFTASGGQAPYKWDVVTNASNGTVQSNGTYVAGTRGSVTDRVRVSDASGQSKIATVTVGPAITITPAAPKTAQGGVIHFVAVGGQPGNYTWTATNGAITKDGTFTAPSADVTVTVTVTDPLGNTASAAVAVGASVGITPSNPSTFPKGTVQFTAFAGGGGYHYAITDNKSGGTIDPNTGLYVAGPTGNVVDTVDVGDANQRHAQATVTVGPGLTITPNGGTAQGNAQVQFSAAGGSGTGYAFSMQSSQSGGNVNAQSGLYTAGTQGGTDVILLVDSVGNQVTASLAVSAGSGTSSGGAGGNGNGSGTGSNTGTTSSSGVVGVGGSKGDSGGCSTSGQSSPSYEWLVGLGIAIIATRRRRAPRLDS